MRRICHKLLWPVLRRPCRWVARSILADYHDPWQRRDVAEKGFGAWGVPFPRAGYFDAYLKRSNSVEANSLEEICQWLSGCTYDAQTYTGKEKWPTPIDFENTRRGTCFDFSLWAWRKLVEFNVPALFMWGQFREENQGTPSWSAAHDWVHFQHEGMEYSFEPTRPDPNSMVGPAADVRSVYRPWYAVDAELRRFEYHGYYHYLFSEP